MWLLSDHALCTCETSVTLARYGCDLEQNIYHLTQAELFLV